MAVGQVVEVFQSTHPRGVRHFVASKINKKTQVSIHAPTWGATNRDMRDREAGEVSIHAPTWGATNIYNIKGGAGGFQSTHPRGVRLVFRSQVMDDNWFQSTHPRGVRHLVVLGARPAMGFNPRTHVGCDREQEISRTTRLLFQSTHPRGVRPLDAAYCCLQLAVSIHAPTWGATW